MKKGIKYSLWVGACVLGLVVVAGLLAPRFIDINAYKPRIEAMVSNQTGRSFSMGDDVDISLFPWVGVRLSDVKLGNPPGFSEPLMAQIQSFEVRLRVLPLIQRRVEIKTFRLEQPRIYLERQKNGKVNWEFTSPEPVLKPMPGKEAPPAESTAPEATGTLPIADLDIRELVLAQGMLTFKEGDKETRVTDVNLRLGNVRLDQPMDLECAVRVDDRPVSVSGKIGPLGPAPGQTDIPLALTVKAVETLALSVTGQVTQPTKTPGFMGDLDLAAFSPKQLFKALEMPLLLEPRDASVLESCSLKGRIQATATEIFVPSGELVLDDSRLTFTARVKAFARPDVNFDIQLDQLDLDRYLPPPQTEPAKADAAEPVPASPPESAPAPVALGEKPGKSQLNKGPLTRLLLHGKLTTGPLKVANMKVDSLSTHIAADGGIFFLESLKLNLYQGRMRSDIRVDLRRKEPRINLVLGMKDIQAGPLTRDVQGKDIIEGTLGGTMELTMRGTTPDRIKRTLSGRGKKVFSNGAIKGIDIASTIRTLAGQLPESDQVKPKTDFAELQVPFMVRNGLSVVEHASLKSPLLRVSADGQTHLVDQTLDFMVVPKLVATLKGQGDETQRTGLSIPLRITGTFAKPTITPDMQAFVRDQVINEKGLLNQYLKDPKGTEKEVKGLLKGLFN